MALAGAAGAAGVGGAKGTDELEDGASGSFRTPHSSSKLALIGSFSSASYAPTSDSFLASCSLRSCSHSSSCASISITSRTPSK